MKNVVILHGAGNNSRGNWFPWLNTTLLAQNYKIWLPDLPHADRPNTTEWTDFVFKNKPFDFGENTVFVGHSAGGTLALRLLEKVPQVVQKTVLVATCVERGTKPEFFKYKDGMLTTPFDWKKIKDSCKEFVFIHSDNDPYQCGSDQGMILQRQLGGQLIIKTGEGHFNLEKGKQYRQFPELLQYL